MQLLISFCELISKIAANLGYELKATDLVSTFLEIWDKVKTFFDDKGMYFLYAAAILLTLWLLLKVIKRR